MKLAFAVLVCASAGVGYFQTQTRSQIQVASPVGSGPLQVAGVPTPSQLVRLSKLDGQLPYTVPVGNVLVITRASLKAQGCEVIPPAALGVHRITFNGSCVWGIFHDLLSSLGGQQHYTFGTDLGSGIAATAGTIVDVQRQGPEVEAVVLLGYLSPANASGLRVVGIPAPDQLMRLSKLDGDLPYTVPAGKVLVINRASLKGQGCQVIPAEALGVHRITFNASCVWAVFHDFWSSQGGEQHYTFGTDLGAGIAAQEGTVVDIVREGTEVEGVVLLGYLEDA
jgi:hypothetical protein